MAAWLLDSYPTERALMQRPKSRATALRDSGIVMAPLCGVHESVMLLDAGTPLTANDTVVCKAGFEVFMRKWQLPVLSCKRAKLWLIKQCNVCCSDRLKPRNSRDSQRSGTCIPWLLTICGDLTHRIADRPYNTSRATLFEMAAPL